MSERVWIESQDWTNPLRSVERQPHLGEIVFAHDSFSESGRLALKQLKTFYSPLRVSGDDERNLDRYLSNPDRPLFLIEGPVGTGKTWFVRYNLLIRKHAHFGQCGVIDMLRHTGQSVRRTIISQLGPIIDSYFISIRTSLNAAITKLFSRMYKLRLGVASDVPLDEVGRATVAMEVEQAIQSNNQAGLTDIRLRALEEYTGPYLFVVIDNLDRLSHTHQKAVLREVTGLLRNTRIRLIVPLRSTSAFLMNWFSGLRQVQHARMTLSSLRVKEMLAPRFKYDANCDALPTGPIASDCGVRYTYQRLFEMLTSDETGQIVESIGKANARIVFEAIERILYSDHLGTIGNISNAAKAIQALMLADHRRADKTSLLTNLLGPVDGKSAVDSRLILLRVAEVAKWANPTSVNFDEQSVKDHLYSYGYTNDKLIMCCIAQLVGCGLLISEDGHDPQAITESVDLSDIGEFRLTDLGSVYFSLFLLQHWYYFAVKRTLVDCLDTWKSFDQHKGYWYMKHSDLYGYLVDIEDGERKCRTEWSGKGHRLATIVPSPLKPSVLARQAISHAKKGSDNE